MEYVSYNANHKVLICREHKCGISPRSLERHFRDEHRAMPHNARKQVLMYAKELPLCEPEQAPIFDQVISAIHGLEVHDGYRCEYGGCNFLAGTLGSIKRHCGAHETTGWNDIEKRFTATKMQTFFQGRNTRYRHFHLAF